MTISDSFITIEGLQVYGYHGVLPIERTVGNMYEISVDLHYDAESAMASDNIDTAINYANVVYEITRAMVSPEQLLEHVAKRIVDRLNSHFEQISSGTLSIKKLKPPINEQMKYVAFTLSWKN
jgi:dihydroneopterin aldolase